MLEPYYDSYAACIAFAGAVRRPVTLRPPDFALDPDALRAAVGPRAPGAAAQHAAQPDRPGARPRGAGGGRRRSASSTTSSASPTRSTSTSSTTASTSRLATLPGMAERTLTISSVGKSFSFTGWKIGWCSGPAELVAAARTAKQFLTFAGGTPLQHAAAAALRLPAPCSVRAARRAARASATCCAPGLTAAGLAAAAVGRHLLHQRRRRRRRGRVLPLRCPSAAASSRSRRASSTTTTRRRRRWCASRSASGDEVIAEAAARLATLKPRSDSP